MFEYRAIQRDEKMPDNSHIHTLGWGGRWLTVHRFFYDHVDCSACTFVEQVPGLTELHARRSGGLQAALVAVALALAGWAGRIAADRQSWAWG